MPEIIVRIKWNDENFDRRDIEGLIISAIDVPCEVTELPPAIEKRMSAEEAIEILVRWMESETSVMNTSLDRPKSHRRLAYEIVERLGFQREKEGI